jgi:protein-disulfide isomerase
MGTLLGFIAMGVFVSGALRSFGPEPVKLERTPVFLAVVDDVGTPGIRPANTDVTVVVFSDYQCGVCRASEPVLRRRLAQDARIRVLYKDWPILGEGSRLAARVALAADYQGKYGAMHDALTRAPGRMDAVGVRRSADAAGVDWARLQSDLKNHTADIDARLAKNSFQAWSLGLEGTPAYLVGPYLVKGKLRDHQLSSKLAAARHS